MDLGDIYCNNVNKSQINMHGTGGMPVSRERDPQIKKLENDVFSSIQSKLNDELPPHSPNTPNTCLLYTSPSPRDRQKSRMPSSA